MGDVGGGHMWRGQSEDTIAESEDTNAFLSCMDLEATDASLR